jgi:hypothetical protein
MGSILPGEDETSWRAYLSPRFYRVPLCALKEATLKELGTYLDLEIRSLDNDLPANYIGLAQVARLNFGIVELLGQHSSPTAALIMEWQTNRFSREAPTIGNLVRALVTLNRLDVAINCRDIISNDANDYLVERQEMPIPRVISLEFRSWADVITTDDLPGRQTLYDAFVCCSELDEDNIFIQQIVDRLEEPPYNLRLYLGARNGLFGVNRYDTDARIMDERCKNVIIIHTPSYDVCWTAAFHTSIAIYLSARDQTRRLIPVLINGYPRSKVPNILTTRTICEFPMPIDDVRLHHLAQSVCRVNLLQARNSFPIATHFEGMR